MTLEPQHRRVLVVDDDEDLLKLVALGLRRHGYQPVTCRSAAEALAILDQLEVDAIVTDLNMPAMGGLELCERVAANRPDLPIVVLTAHGTLDSAVGALRAGAWDFVTKPLVLDVLSARLERVLGERALREEVKRLHRLVEEQPRFDDLIGSSAPMQEVRALLGRVTQTDASVLITGESGTGKEVVARGLHRRGRRAGGPFVAVNCAALPEQLLESELFGHARGAFTDARFDRPGLFVQARGGTLFLDEIGEMPLGLQPKLLRVLEERAVRPVGADKEVPVDVRIIAATNRDIETAVAERRFREDLFFRVNVVHLDMPPLRARGGDVLLLAQHFLQHYARQTTKEVTGILPAAAERLLAYQWPGNVRELRNCMERAVALTQYSQITVEDLPEKIRSWKRSHVLVASDDPTELVPMEEVERRYVLKVLEAVGGNKTVAARVLGFDRKTLYRKLERYGVAVDDK